MVCFFIDIVTLLQQHTGFLARVYCLNILKLYAFNDIVTLLQQHTGFWLGFIILTSWNGMLIAIVI